MADISKITLPSNVTYDVKDTTARSGLANKQDKITAITAQTTQAVYPIKIDSQGHITAYGSAVTIPAAVSTTQKVYTGSCDTLSTTLEKVVTLHDATGFNLTAGVVIIIYFENMSGTFSGTSAISLNVNNTGSKTVYRGSVEVKNSYSDLGGWNDKSIVGFAYDGAHWNRFYSMDNNTTYLEMTEAEAKAGTVVNAKVISPSVLATAIDYRLPTKTSQLTNDSGFLTSHQDISGKVNKSGDTMTGDLKLHREGTTANNYPSKLIFENKDTTTGQTYDNAYVAAYNDHASTTYGTNMVIHSGGGMFIGSGESPANHYTAKGTSYTGEDTFVTADTNLYLQGNGNDINNRKGFAVNTSGELVPIVKDVATNNSGGIGNSSNKIANGYFTNINGVAVGTSPKFTDTTYGADRGISNVSGNFGHSNTAITAQTTQAVYPIKIDAYGHITGYGSAVTIPAAVAVKGNSESTYRTGNVNLTAANIGAAASSHAHGNITSGGDITTTATIAAGDRLVINDESASKITNSSITFGASTTNYLRNDGTWNIPEKGTLIYNRTSSSATKHTVLDFTTIASGTGSGVDIKPIIDLLWENSAPTANFSAQTISLNLNDYRYVFVTAYNSSTGESLNITGLAKIGSNHTYIIGSAASSTMRYRVFEPTFSGIQFGTGYRYTSYATNASTDAGSLIPYQIYGIK